MYCPQCRAELPDDAKFCFKCGYDFARLKTPPVRKASTDSLDGLETSIGQETDTDSLAKGSLFANRYEILSEGLKGGMGAVYKCSDRKLNKTVALKIIHPRLLSSKQAMSLFRQEVSISQELQHPHIVKVFNLEEWEGKEYFTMEWVEGETLRDVINKRKKENRPFSLEEANIIISQLCEALEYAHQHTIHRDIKPENVLVSDEKNLTLKLTDFGIAKMLSPSQFTSTSIQMGTPYYMAPEQKIDAANVDKRADIYALGVILFELVTLENTIGFELPSEINKKLPKEIDNIIKKAVATNPKDRYLSVREFSEALSSIVVRARKIAEGLQDTAEPKRQEEFKKIAIEAEKIKEVKTGEKYIAVSAVVVILLLLIGVLGYKFFVSTNESGNIIAPQAKSFVDSEKGAEMPQKSEKETKDMTKNARTTEDSQISTGQSTDRLSEFKALINQGIAIHPTKPNVSLVIDSAGNNSGTAPESKLYSIFKTEKANIIVNLFKEKQFKSKGFFREMYDGNTDLLRQPGIFDKIDYLILGKLNYSFKKGSQIDTDLISCNITFDYRIISTKGNGVNTESIRVIGPGFSEDAALERGLEILSEQYSEKILKSIL